MNAIQQEWQRSADPGGDPDSRALDRFEDEGGPGPEDTRDRRTDAPTSGPTRRRSLVDGGRVVVTPGVTASSCRIHHRDIPELQADGATTREAAANLAQDLAREIEGVADHRLRERFGQVLDDVRAFVEGP